MAPVVTCCRTRACGRARRSTIEWKKPIEDEFLAFDVQAGVDGLGLQAPNTRDSAFLTEVGVATSALFRVPNGKWGAWGGISYAVPVQHSGSDPTTGLAIDPQPRLDFHAGTVLSLVKEWDLYADFAVIDRGDAANPATRLPILDGGFDQKQIVFGVIRHIDGPQALRWRRRRFAAAQRALRGYSKTLGE